MSEKIIIAIDGPSGAGKSTLSKKLAKTLGYANIDTGAMYRCIALAANRQGVEPTNNIAERGIRPAVQWRKICFGNRSDNGATLTSRLLTVTRTCWLQKRNPLEFLVDTVTAHRSGQTAPSLI